MTKITQNQKSNQKIQDIILIIIYIAYFLLMAKILLFKNVAPSEIFSSDREISRTLAIIPFQSIMKYYNSGVLWASVLNVIGNIVIFIPFGIYLTLYTKNKTLKKATFITLVTSLSVEVVQYVLDIGIADIDDIILNVIGGVVGVLVYKILRLILKQDKNVKIALITVIFIFILIYIGLMIYASSKGLRVKLM